MNNVVGKYKAIWNRQDGKCSRCGESMLVDQKKSIVQVQYPKSRFSKNLAYIHSQCEQHKIEFIKTEDPMENYEDIRCIINSLSNKCKKKVKRNKFEALTEYFYKKTEAIFTLKFEEIADIIESPLCKSAFKSSGYWHNKGLGNISDSWLSNGYKIKRLNLCNRRIVFARTSDRLPSNIPDVFLKERLPKNAKAELETFLGYLRKKYGL